MEIDIETGAPDAFSHDEHRRFCKLIAAGEEVDTAVLLHNVENAKTLVLARSGGKLLGVAALKFPKLSYRNKISEKSGFNLRSDLYPYELGYVFIQEVARGLGLSHRLVAAALEEADRNQVFATVRSDNYGMMRTLEQAKFSQVGDDYKGRRTGTSIRLLVRNG